MDDIRLLLTEHLIQIRQIRLPRCLSLSMGLNLKKTFYTFLKACWDMCLLRGYPRQIKCIKSQHTFARASLLITEICKHNAPFFQKKGT